jgi:DNA-binding transcriptional ArsR family regulator
MRTTLAAELPAVRAWGDAAVRTELTETLRQRWAPADLGWLAGAGWAGRVAELVERTWTVGIQPDWARRRGGLERDVMYRAGLLAAYGWPRALERMSRHSAWIGADAIRYSSRPGPDRRVGDEGMMFVPVSLSAGTWLAENDGRDFAVVYPARGSAAALPATASGALERLIGAGRARILRELERPATPTELAAALGLSLGTVGAHLGVLRDAGMVRAARVGRKVVYRRTDAADPLLAPALMSHPAQ